MADLTKVEFIKRLVDAGWGKREAEAEWKRIQDEPEEDWEGQL